MSQTTSSVVSLQGGTIQDGTMIASGAGYSFQAGTVSANLGGSAGLTKSGNGMVTLSGNNSYSGGTVVSQGTLNVVAGALPAGGNVQLAAGATLSGSGVVRGNIVGAVGATIAATGNMVLGDSTSYTAYNHAGTLAVGANIVTLNGAAFSNLGVLTTLSGGTLAAPNGVTIPLGGNLVGLGTVKAKVAAGNGSTISLTGDLTLGDSTKPNGFYSDGELYTNGYTATLNSSNAAGNKNAVVLGSLTDIEGGRINAASGIALTTGKSLVSASGGTVSIGSGPATSQFLNRGSVQGPDISTSIFMSFDMSFRGSTGQTSGNLGFLRGFHTGDSPGINIHVGNMELGGQSEVDIGGPTLGIGDGYYGQLGVTGNLVLLDGAELDIKHWNNYLPCTTDSFTVLTWGETFSGNRPTLVIDPWYASQGITFTPNWTANGLTLTVVPEPASFVLLGVGALGLVGYGLRRRQSTRRMAQANDAPVTLSFPWHSSPASATRRAA